MSTRCKVVTLDGEHFQIAETATLRFGAKKFVLDNATGSATLTFGAAGFKRRRLFVKTESGAGEGSLIVYLGDANVSASDGFPMYPGDELELDVDHNATVKALIDSPGFGEQATVYIMELE